VIEARFYSGKDWTPFFAEIRKKNATAVPLVACPRCESGENQTMSSSVFGPFEIAAAIR
jgi:hypothetical protein